MLSQCIQLYSNTSTHDEKFSTSLIVFEAMVTFPGTYYLLHFHTGPFVIILHHFYKFSDLDTSSDGANTPRKWYQ